MAKKRNIQHRAFAGRHRPDYYSSGRQFDYGRADGIPYSLAPVVVCASCSVESPHIQGLMLRMDASFGRIDVG